MTNDITGDPSEKSFFHFKSGNDEFNQVEVSQDLQTIPLNVSCCDSLAWFLDTGNEITSQRNYSLNFNVNITDVNSDNVTIQWNKIESCCFEGNGLS